MIALALLLAADAAVKVTAPVVALTHVRVIDGLGHPPQPDTTVVIAKGRIQFIGGKVPEGAVVLDLPGRTVLPGLVGMHDHLFMTAVINQKLGLRQISQVSVSAPRLYLASGVTTIRTTGSLEPYADLNLKARIDRGDTPGPRIFVTAPYLEGKDSVFLQMHELRDEADARRMVNFWADAGATSFKAYMKITRAELGAAVEEAHKRGLKVTGHLCSVTYREAAELGIDNLEHGFFVASDFVPGKKPDACPETVGESLAKIDPDSPEVKSLLQELVRRKVAITSTLPVFEAGLLRKLPEPRVLELLSSEARLSILQLRATTGSKPTPPHFAEWYRMAALLERRFVEAGGLLIAGSDPTGPGAVLAGLADQREVELLVEAAGFTPLEAIRIATSNGARFLGAQDFGSVEPGKYADLVVVRGDPSTKIADIENVELVFKEGAGYDPQRLLEPVRGLVGAQ